MTSICEDCQKPTHEPETCETCGKVVCPDCACHDENLLHTWCDFCANTLPANDAPEPDPSRTAQIVQAAAQLYDNRLGWSDGRGPYAPPELWDDLGRALGRDAGGFCCNTEAQP